jgi:hypothetical protein
MLTTEIASICHNIRNGFADYFSSNNGTNKNCSAIQCEFGQTKRATERFLPTVALPTGNASPYVLS